MRLTFANVLVFAPDLSGARAFYGDVLGLAVEAETSEHVVFRGGDFQLTVFICEGGDADPSTHSRCAGSAVAFAVESLDAAMRELRSRGVRFLHETPNGGPLGRYAAFADPFGTVHELVERV